MKHVVENEMEAIFKGEQPYIEDKVEQDKERARSILRVLSERRASVQNDLRTHIQENIKINTRNLIHKLIHGAWQRETVQKIKSTNKCIAPSTENIQILAKFKEQIVSKIKTLSVITIQKNRSDDNYSTLLQESQTYDSLIQSIQSRRKKKFNRLGYRVQIVHVQLLELIYQQIIDRCKNRFHKLYSNKKSFVKKVKCFESITARMRRNCQRITDCAQIKKTKVAEKKQELEEIEHQTQEINQDFKQLCQTFEEKSKNSTEYQDNLRRFDELKNEIERVEDVNTRDLSTLNDLAQQLEISQGKIKKRNIFLKDLSERKTLIEQRRKIWKRRDTIQESLKEIIRMKTGVILREEDVQARINQSIKETQNTRNKLEERLHNLKYQNRKLLLKCQKYSSTNLLNVQPFMKGVVC